MTKQEEIREGIADIFDTPLTDKEDDELESVRGLSLLLATKIISFLHSQGVVLKVERELPKGASVTIVEGGQSVIIPISILTKAGYVAVESLGAIDEGN